MSQQEVSVAFRPLNVTLSPRSKAHAAYARAAKLATEELGPGFQPRPDLDLTRRGGRTISDLVFVNCYLGGDAAWSQDDRDAIDHALDAAMSDAGLQTVMAQYYDGPITSQMLPSRVVDGALHGRFFKDQAEQMATQLAYDGVLGDADPASAVIDMMLPEGVVLVDGNSDGSEVERAPNLPEGFEEDDEAADSKHGLGGYHGSIHHRGKTYYYAVGVYSEGANGIAIDGWQPWENVVATFYHELNEARTDPDVEDVIRTGDMRKLGWYSQQGGEIGDIPISLADRMNVPDPLGLVFKKVALAGGDTVPVQLMWSNRDHGPSAGDGQAQA